MLLNISGKGGKIFIPNLEKIGKKRIYHKIIILLFIILVIVYILFFKIGKKRIGKIGM